MSFLRNVWYAAAWADELQSGSRPMIARTVANEPLVIFRSEAGTTTTLQDRCPHRFAPLSMGKLTDQGLRCGYHGLEFGRSGACVGNPHGPILRSLNVRCYPTVERDGVIWVWFGVNAPHDNSLPDLSIVSRVSENAFSKGYLPTAASHLLMTDNILDLSHADYLHPDTLGGGATTRARAEVEAGSDSVRVTWHCSNETPAPIFQHFLPTPDTRVDTWTEVEWFPNGVMTLHAGATPAGTPRTAGIDTWNVHIMTPESEDKTHYFYCNTRNYLMDDAGFNRLFAASLRAAFEQEDKPMIEAQQRRIGSVDLLEQRPTLLVIDSASVRVRRMYQQMLKQETAQIAV